MRPKTHRVTGGNWLRPVFLWLPHVPRHTGTLTQINKNVININGSWVGQLVLRRTKKKQASSLTTQYSDHRVICKLSIHGTHYTNTATPTASFASWLVLLTFTEKIFAVCPVCMESSFLWCSGSHTIVCWSSEPEASKLWAELGALTSQVPRLPPSYPHSRG